MVEDGWKLAQVVRVVSREKRGIALRIGRVALGLILMSVYAGAAPEPLILVRAIDLPHVEGRIDHLAFDSTTQRLYIAALGNNTVEVLDAAAGTHLKSLPGFREPQGIAVVPGLRSVVVANGQGDGLQLISAEDYRRGATIRVGDDADNVRFDPSAKRVYVGFGGGAVAVVDPANAKVLGEAKLLGHPESFQLESGGSRLFVNVPSAEQIAVVDRTSMKVTATWPVTSAGANYPMALDEKNHRVFVGCRQPAKALVFDTNSGKQTAAFDIVGDTDDLFYDAARQRLYVTGGEGYLDVVQDEGANKFTRLARIPTASGARTSLFVAVQRRLYVAVPHRGNQKAEIRVFEAR
jgi:DNA-binding beta-propeller fold protein YncE